MEVSLHDSVQLAAFTVNDVCNGVKLANSAPTWLTHLSCVLLV